MKVELLKWMNDYGVKVENLRYLLENSDEVIQNIMSCENEMNRGELVKFCSKTKFKEMDNELRDEVFEIIKNARFPVYVVNVVLNGRIFEIEDSLKILRIIANAKEEYQAEYSSYVPRSSVVLESGKAVELTQVIADAKEEYQAKYGYHVTQNEDVHNSGKAVELTKAVVNAKGETQVKYGCALVNYSVVALESEWAVELTQAIADSEREDQAQAGYEVASSERVHNSGKALELTQIVTRSQCQAKYSAYVVRRGDIIKSEKVVDLIKIVANCYFRGIPKIVVKLFERAQMLGIESDCMFMLEKIANNEYMEQLESYLIKKQKLKYAMDAMDSSDLSTLINLLEQSDSPEERLNDILKQKSLHI